MNKLTNVQLEINLGMESTENNQQMSEIYFKNFPSDWQLMPLKNAVDYIDYGYSKSIPKIPPENGMKIVSTADISKTGELLYSKIRKVEAPLKTIERLTLKDGDVLFNWRNSAYLIGKTTIFEKQPEPHIFASFILRLKCDEKKSHNYFFKYLLNYFRFAGVFESLARRAVNQANFNKNEVSDLIIPLPPIEEQIKIACVLSLVQKAISEQEKAIALTTELKKALMQKLFTEGLNNEPQKMTEIGLIPKSWEVKKIKELNTIIQSGQTPSRKKQNFFGGKIKWVKTLDLNEDIVIDTEEYLTDEGFNYLRKKLRPIDTVMVAMYGGSGTIGKTGILGIEATTNQAVCCIEPNSKIFNSRYLLHYFVYFRPKWMQFAIGTRKDPNISKGTIENKKIPFPTLKEQAKIAYILDNFVLKINNLIQKKEQLQYLFQTLLHQLMTAQIRVDELDLSVLEQQIKE